MTLAGLAGFGGVEDTLAVAAANAIRAPQLQRYLYSTGENLARQALVLPGFGPKPVAAKSGTAWLDTLLAPVTDPLVAGASAQAQRTFIPWALAALALAGVAGYALGKRRRR